MGYRIHHSPVYQVTYGDGYFSNQTAEINRLLYDNSQDIQFDGNDVECSEIIRIPRADLANLIGKITADREDFAKYLDLIGIDTTPEEFITILCEWIAASDQRNDYVTLTWF